MGHELYKGLLIVIGMLLLVASVSDIKRRQISKILIVGLFLMCIIAMLFQKTFDLYNTIGGGMIGLCAIGVSMASQEQIGRGDGLVLLGIGALLGFRSGLAIVFVASCIMCIVAMVILICKKGNRHTKLPFLPALFVGYVVCVTQMLS